MTADAPHDPDAAADSGRRREVSVRESSLSPLVGAWLLAAAAAAVFLAGGPQQGSLGLFLVAAGLALVLCPPRVTVDWRLWAAGAGLILCALLAFLPVRWFGVPAWRQAMQTAIHLPGSVTPIPWETGFWLAILAFSILVGLFLLAHPVRSQPRLILGVLAAALCAVYAGLAIYARKSGWHYPFSGEASFGFFPNRNHTATFLISGSILAMGVLGVALRDGRWLSAAVAAAALALCLVALFFFSASRGGIIFLAAGTLLWVIGLGRKHADVRVLVSVCALVLAGGALFLKSGSDVRNRLVGSIQQEVKAPLTGGPPGRNSEDTPFDFRVLIYRDTMGLIRDFPLTGTGLGAYALDFAHYRKASLADTAVIHPESDWLMLAAEAGLPALLCGGGILWLLAVRLRGGWAHPFWPLRWGYVVAATAALLHGAVDVPVHRVALGWWILVIAALGLQTGRPGHPKPSRVQHVLFVLGGVGALFLGVQLLRAEWFGGRALPPFVATQAQARVLAAFQRGNAEGAMNLARAAVRDSPMAAPLYYQLGVLLLRFEGTDAEADAAFLAQRLLNPTWPDIPFQQGQAWIGIDPKKTTALWLDALELRRRIDVAQGSSPDDASGLYGDMLSRLRQFPAAREGLDGQATRSPSYALAWLSNVSPNVVAAGIGQLTDRPELLREFTAQQRQKFLVLWSAKGGSDAVEAFLRDHLDWRSAAWPVELAALVQAGKFEQAARQAAKHYNISLLLAPPGQAETPVEASTPTGDVVSRFNQYWLAGNTVAARRVLMEAAANGDGEQPRSVEYWRLRAAVAAQDGAWAHSWEYLERALQQKFPAVIFP